MIKDRNLKFAVKASTFITVHFLFLSLRASHYPAFYNTTAAARQKRTKTIVKGIPEEEAKAYGQQEEKMEGVTVYSYNDIQQASNFAAPSLYREPRASFDLSRIARTG